MQNNNLTFYRVNPEKLSDLVMDSKIPNGATIRFFGNNYIISQDREHFARLVMHIVEYKGIDEGVTTLIVRNPPDNLSKIVESYRI